ncbi:fused MFS/spermidine synthase [Streptomyces capparidis]
MTGRPPGDGGGEPVPAVRAVGFGLARLMPDVDRRRAWLLTVDDAPQSYVDLDDPEHLEFEYTRRIGHVVDTAAPPGAPLDVLHLGGGGLTLPRYVAATRPGSRQCVVEADTALAELVAERLPLPPDAGVEVRTGDARRALADFPDAAFDLLVVDVFGGSRVPAHLTSRQFAAEAARTLRPHGRYVANLADGPPLAFARGQTVTLLAVWPRVCLIAEAQVLRGRRYGNVVLAAGRSEPPVAALARRLAADPFPARLEHGDRVGVFAAGARPVDDADATASPPPPEGAFRLG